MARIILKGIAGCLRGEVFLFEEKGVCLVGRTDDCNIKITREQDIAISRRHCMLIIDPPNIKVRDLFSTNGTYVDDERLIPKVKDQSSEYDEQFDRELKHGDRISVGGIVFLVEISSELNPNQSDKGYAAGIYTTKTTKTRLIPFERATTRAGSLIPQEKLPPGTPKEEPTEPSETQRLLSMPITEPIPREMFLAATEKDANDQSAPSESEQEATFEPEDSSLDDIPEAIPLPESPELPKRKIIDVCDPEDIVHVLDPITEAQTNIIDLNNQESKLPSALATPPPVPPLVSPPQEHLVIEPTPAQKEEEPKQPDHIILVPKEVAGQETAAQPSPPQHVPIVQESPSPEKDVQEAVFKNSDQEPKAEKDEPHIIGDLPHEKEESSDDADSPTGETRGMPGWSHTDLG